MPEATFAALQASPAGEVIVPGSAGYDAACRPANARFRDTRPAAVVRCGDAADVAATVRFACRSRLAVAVRSGSHCFAGRSSTAGIVIDVSPMGGDAVSGDVATVGAGRADDPDDVFHVRQGLDPGT